MNAADFAVQSDPDRNPQFSRRWESPPDLQKRERRPVQGAAPIASSIVTNSTEYTPNPAKWLAREFGLALPIAAIIAREAGLGRAGAA